MLWSDLSAQNNRYGLRFDLTSIDTTTKIACYDLQIRNVGPENWALGGGNLSIFYDASVARLIDSTLMIVNDPNNEYGLGVLNNVVFEDNFPSLNYADSAGFFRLSITVNLAINGLTIPNDSSWVSFANMCFDLLIDDITSPNTCFQINFRTDESGNDTGAPEDQLQELIGGSLSAVPVIRDMNEDLIPDNTKSSCFILEEDTTDLCTDGIDNDDDGLIDCQDSGCSFQCGEDNITSCSDGIDNDLDGLIDCLDEGCSTMYESFTPLSPSNCPDLNNGALELTFSIATIEVSVDSGETYVPSTTITGLSPGTYNIFYRNTMTGCVEESLFNPFVLDASQDCLENTESKCSDGIDNDANGLVDCEEVSCQTITGCMVMTESTTAACQDGIDNDGDGLVDCSDSDCSSYNFCNAIVDSLIYIPNVFSRTSTFASNRMFVITAKEDLQVVTYMIYDRSGNKVFEKNNMNLFNTEMMWDGLYNNRVVTSGVYVYVLNVLIENEPHTFKGDITVLK